MEVVQNTEIHLKKTLGISWDTNLDTLKVELNIDNKPDTRSKLLRRTTYIYDPIGFFIVVYFER